MHNPLITASEIGEIINNEKITILDSRPNVEDYKKGHIMSAYHLNLNSDLSVVHDDYSLGGRHPLPSPKLFSEVLSSVGITLDSQVIIYDQADASMAATRLWWMIKAAGIMDVKILNGGYNMALAHCIPIEKQNRENNKSSNFSFTQWKLPLVNINQVEKATQDTSKIIIDVRSPERYKGLKEPIDCVAGHIPNAINIPYTKHLNQDGTFKNAEEIRSLYQAIYDKYSPEDIIVHCGSGVTACHTLFALNVAGYSIPNLYVGSWSEWSRNEKSIVTK